LTIWKKKKEKNPQSPQKADGKVCKTHRFVKLTKHVWERKEEFGKNITKEKNPSCSGKIDRVRTRKIK